jgi:hypothetical protein
MLSVGGLNLQDLDPMGRMIIALLREEATYTEVSSVTSDVILRRNLTRDLTSISKLS